MRKMLEVIIEFGREMAYHTPKEGLSQKEIEKVKQNGLIHFCEKKNVESILENGVVANKKAEIIHTKGNRKLYDAYVVITELSEEQIRELKIRRTDNAVTYSGTLYTTNMRVGDLEI